MLIHKPHVAQQSHSTYQSPQHTLRRGTYTTDQRHSLTDPANRSLRAARQNPPDLHLRLPPGWKQILNSTEASSLAPRLASTPATSSIPTPTNVASSPLTISLRAPRRVAHPVSTHLNILPCFAASVAAIPLRRDRDPRPVSLEHGCSALHFYGAGHGPGVLRDFGLR